MLNQSFWKKQSYQLHLSNKLLSYLWNKFFSQDNGSKVAELLVQNKANDHAAKEVVFFCF